MGSEMCIRDRVISIKITGEDEKVLEEKLKSLVNNYFGEGI